MAYRFSHVSSKLILVLRMDTLTKSHHVGAERVSGAYFRCVQRVCFLFCA